MNSRNISKIITIGVLLIVIIAIILLFQGNGDTAKIELKGSTEMVIYQNDIFVDPGYNIVDASNTNGFYVNIEGIVNTNKIGIYYLKYVLYNKNASLVSTAERQVIVLEDKATNITLELNGEEEEYFFVNDYIDNGAIAYQNNNDITNQIIVDSNVNPNKTGRYEVKYQVNINNKIKEIVRVVNIIDFDIKEDIDINNLKINLLVNCDNYYYTLLPDGLKEYSKDISYSFINIGEYEFDIYLKNGSHKKYNVNIATIDNEGPIGTCSLYYEGSKTTITMNVTDKSGISKYSYNGLDFYDNKTTINNMATNVIVRAYDNINNYRDIKCKAEYGTGFRNISVDAGGRVQGKSGYMDKLCNTTKYTKENQELDALMQSYGYKTRGAVCSAAVYLATYKYDVPYFWGGKYDGKGFNPLWGCKGNHSKEHGCSIPYSSDNSVCAKGLDCGGLVGWAYRQAGFDNSIIRYEDIVKRNWGNFNPSTHYYKFTSSNQAYINQIKPGDLIHREGHIGIIIGVTNDKLQVAEMLGPLLITTYNKNTGASLSRQKSFTHFVLMDEFYKMYGN